MMRVKRGQHKFGIVQFEKSKEIDIENVYKMRRLLALFSS